MKNEIARKTSHPVSFMLTIPDIERIDEKTKAGKEKLYLLLENLMTKIKSLGQLEFLKERKVLVEAKLKRLK